jgi:nucleotide-binding universal stress UspA family protein
MYKKMLVLLDGSKLSEAVFTYARELAGRLNLDLDLLNVCNQDEADQLPMRQGYIDHMAQTLRLQSEEIRAKAGAKAGEKGIEVRGQVIVGYPPDEILKYAEENSIDLIMLSTHGKSGIRRWDLGGIADKVIHAATKPIWLVPSEIREEIIFDKLPTRTVLIPLDGSKHAESVIPHILELAKMRGTPAETVLLNVKVPPRPYGRTWAEVPDEAEFDVNTYMNGIIKKFKAAGLPARAVCLEGIPADEILKYARQNHPQLIAMSTHGNSIFSHLLYPDVTENVVRRLKKTPIFLVKPNS